MLGTAQANTNRTKVASHLSIVWRIGVGADGQALVLVGQKHQFAEVTRQIRITGRDLAFVNATGRTIERDPVAFVINLAFNGHRARFRIDTNRASARDAALAHATRHNGSVRSHAATCGENPLGNSHTAQVFRRGFLTNQNHGFAIGNPLFGFVSEKDDLAGRRPRRGRQTFGDDLGALDGAAFKDRVQKFIQTIRINTQQCSFFVDHALREHFHRRANQCSTGTLGRTGLQHPQLAFLDGELDILHIFIVIFQRRLGLDQLSVDLWHDFFERREFGGAIGFADLCQLCPTTRAIQRDLLRRTDTGHNVLTLRIDQEFAVKHVFTGRCIARKGNARTAAVTEVTEDHGLHVNRRTPGARNIVHLTVEHGAVVIPALEHGHHGTPQLFPRIVREFATKTRTNHRLEFADHLLEVVDAQIGVELNALLLFDFIDNYFKRIVIFLRFGLQAHNDVAVHLDEAAIGVPSETFIA